MQSIEEQGRQIPVVREVDVLVAGGGTAGVPAAVAAARRGAKVLVLEQFGFLGGTQTGGLVAPICPNYDREGRPLTRGIGQEIWDRLAARGGTVPTQGGKYEFGDWPWFDPERLKLVLDDMIEEAGVEVLFQTWIADTVMEGDRIRGIIIENKSGRQAVLARLTIDATGDADVAFRAGVPFESGRKKDGLNQGVALRFHLGNVDLPRVAAFLRENGMPHIQDPTVSYAEGSGEKDIEPVIRKALEAGKVDREVIHYFQFYTVPGRPNEISFNCPEIWVKDPTDAFDLSRVQRTGRRLVQKTADFCRECIPGFENAYLLQIAPMIGIRTSRRITGEYVLTEEDVLEGRKFPDGVARNAWAPDIHAPAEEDNLVFKESEMKGGWVEIPYRCLVPLRAENLLVAGRCISSTFEALAAIRISRTCQALGQAAGTAAALCLDRQSTPRALPGEAVSRLLAEDGLF